MYLMENGIGQLCRGLLFDTAVGGHAVGFDIGDVRYQAV